MLFKSVRSRITIIAPCWRFLRPLALGRNDKKISGQAGNDGKEIPSLRSE